ncbi:hypothetical protein FIS3754_39040 [Fischerella sp. NIES-3754]|nr:hypothetical protein FIS3754_39040 [Fischerella sp. NIES-3754]BCX10317.1 MAG: hypothetical protein KatS3mg066_4176 [Fischerella sp.]
MTSIPHTSHTPHTPHTPPFTEALLYLEAYERVYGFALTLMGPVSSPSPITPSPQSYRRAVRTSKNKPNANPKKLGSQAATKGDRKPVSPNVRATCNVV